MTLGLLCAAHPVLLALGVTAGPVCIVSNPVDEPNPRVVQFEAARANHHTRVARILEEARLLDTLPPVTMTFAAPVVAVSAPKPPTFPEVVIDIPRSPTTTASHDRSEANACGTPRRTQEDLSASDS